MKATQNERGELVNADGDLLRDSEPVELTVYRGTGRPDPKSIYAPGATGPIMGNSEDRYYAVFHDDAKRFGPDVKMHSIVLKNPFVLDSRDKVFEAFDGRGPAPSTRQEDHTEWPWLREKLINAGHDGLIVNIGKYGEKLLRRPFGIAQVVVFKSADFSD